MRVPAAAFLLILALCAAAPPLPRFNPAAPENRQVLPAFNYASVELVLNQIGVRHQRGGTPERPALAITFANGRRAAIVFSSCERQGAVCKAISIQSVWPRPAGLTPDRLARNVQLFNQRYAFSRASLTQDGRAALQRYLTADYGFIRGDLAVNLLVFATQAERFQAEALAPPAPAPARR